MTIADIEKVPMPASDAGAALIAGKVPAPEFLGYQGRAHPSLPLIRSASGSPLGEPDPPGRVRARARAVGAARLRDGGRGAGPVAPLGTPALAAHCHTAGGGQLMVVLQWPAKRGPADARRGTGTRRRRGVDGFRMAKLVLCVDEDVDVGADQDLWWAMVTRFQADQDLRVLADREGFPLDPSQHTGYSRSLSADGRTAKAVFD